jgi:hypothetical protein
MTFFAILPNTYGDNSNKGGKKIAAELSIAEKQVTATVALLDEAILKSLADMGKLRPAMGKHVEII